MVTPSALATRFIVSRTRQAPVPLASISIPVRQMIVDLSGRGALYAGESPSVTTSRHTVFMCRAFARTPW